MTPITSWRPFRSFVRRVGLFDDFYRELPAIVGDPARSTAGDPGSDDEETSTASTSQGAEGIHFRRKS